ncbi:hypothetical protein [Nostoc sp. 'Peltigera membranacea cyanobiont' N6]|uniref:hypothetical protein n=2 Tax=unclassified Nostoc TaxID=2593658 RepID=UPI000CF302A2|nr:hypothetical protein [Nostoc sp. 'Peltigera membranacea cyanobiont' N6]
MVSLNKLDTVYSVLIMNDKGYVRLLPVLLLIFVWFGGCTVIKDMTTEEVRSPYTGEMVHVDKPITWEKGVVKGLFVSMIIISGALLKSIE